MALSLEGENLVAVGAAVATVVDRGTRVCGVGAMETFRSPVMVMSAVAEKQAAAHN